MAIIHATEENFGTLINEELVLVDFFANWCGPCKMLSPVLESIADDRDGLKIIKVDVDECENLARNYGIMSIPTLLLFKNGTLKSTRTGFMSLEQIRSWIEEEK